MAAAIPGNNLHLNLFVCSSSARRTERQEVEPFRRLLVQGILSFVPRTKRFVVFWRSSPKKKG